MRRDTSQKFLSKLQKKVENVNYCIALSYQKVAKRKRMLEILQRKYILRSLICEVSGVLSLPPCANKIQEIKTFSHIKAQFISQQNIFDLDKVRQLSVDIARKV